MSDSEQRYYHIDIAGCSRELPICPISDEMDIAGFVMLGDVEICPGTDRVTMIPYRTIDGGGSVLGAVTLDRMEAVQGTRSLVYERPLVAASPASLKMRNGCRILLHT